MTTKTKTTAPNEIRLHTVEDIANELFDWEAELFEALNLAVAVKMMATSGAVSKEPAAALETVADGIVCRLESLTTRWNSLLKVAVQAELA